MGRARGAQDSFNFEQHVQRQRDFSERTFGPDARAASVIGHIRK
ncbi:TPA: DUF550 domain-containing protein, partial [Pseudomonas aeruginosa]|nr:DUF550 domain-containing protein [Pseudomonas aeruginosa]